MLNLPSVGAYLNNIQQLQVQNAQTTQFIQSLLDLQRSQTSESFPVAANMPTLNALANNLNNAAAAEILRVNSNPSNAVPSSVLPLLGSAAPSGTSSSPGNAALFGGAAIVSGDTANPPGGPSPLITADGSAFYAQSILKDSASAKPEMSEEQKKQQDLEMVVQAFQKYNAKYPDNQLTLDDYLKASPI